MTQRTAVQDALQIVTAAIAQVTPDAAVERALAGQRFPGRVFLVAIGKAAWQMASAATHCLGSQISDGIVVTKYGHVKSTIPHMYCYEAGHPMPDENSYLATEAVLNLTADLKESDTVLFLVSGGGSALFEKPLISPTELARITAQLLTCGADIVEMNTIRKRLSAVKGGLFATWCHPAQIYSVILSDILGDPLDMIASGPAAADPSTCRQALEIAKKYNLALSQQAMDCLMTETPKSLDNTRTNVIGSVRELCSAAQTECKALGYEPVFLTDQLSCEAREAGSFLASIVKAHAAGGKSLAFIAGGETVVHVSGDGKGGRNQELALAAAAGIAGIEGAAVISAGSDGTDGPTDAAGGYVDGSTLKKLAAQQLDIFDVLQRNDAYHALEALDQLVITGPTGTNVNDITIGLLKKEKKRGML